MGVCLARGGSKRVPRKNIKPLADVPLIGWTISCAQIASRLDAFVVSSEDDEILEVAKGMGSHVIRRPPDMATDEASSYPALLHALDQFDVPFDFLCLLQPTSPFRLPTDVDYAITLAEHYEVAAVVSATATDEEMESGKAVFFNDEFPPNGAIYVGRTDWLRDGGNFDAPGLGRFYMSPDRSLDIDTPEDFLAAEQEVQRRMEWDE